MSKDKRYFDIPEPVQALNLITKEPLQKVKKSWKPPKDDPKAVPGVQDMVKDDLWTLERYLTSWVLCLEDWQKGVVNQHLSRKVLDALDGVETGQRVGISTAAWRKLKETFEDDEFTVTWPLGPQLAHFTDVIIDATDKALTEVPSKEGSEEE